jgi:hypothetical protein
MLKSSLRYLLLLISLFALTQAFATVPGDASTSNGVGKRVYEFACSNCHAPKAAKVMRAPAAFDAAAWKSRVAQAKKIVAEQPNRFKNVDAYFLHQVKIGRGLMHHGGLCFETQKTNKDCSDSALMEAIYYMRSQH